MFPSTSSYRVRILTLVAALFALAVIPFVSLAQDATAKKEHADHERHADDAQATDSSLSDQLRALQTKVAALEAALKQNHQGASPDPSAHATHSAHPADRASAMRNADQSPSGMKMGAKRGGQMGMGKKGMGTDDVAGEMDGMGTNKKPAGGMSAMGGGKAGMGGSTMGMMDQQMMQMMQMMQQMMDMKMMGKGMGSDIPEMKGMQTPGMKGMEMGKKGMEMMGGKGMAGMQTPSALPGFPGTSHIYHTGATGFFLDHAEHITLTTEQQTALNQAKEKGLLEQSSFQGKIDDAEQELWTLTASDQPEAKNIEAKVREIEKLRSDQRLAFIRSVGKAAKVLTPEQREMLVGAMMSNHNPTTTSDQN